MGSTEELLRAAAAQGIEAPAAGEDADAVDGVRPRLVASPTSATALAATVAWAARERLRTVVRGGGSKIAWGRTPAAVDLVISTARLNRVVAHNHGDLTTTIEAGAALQDVAPILARQRQWLPVDTPFSAATIGGIVATNDAGPLRHRYGTARDLLIGVTLALTDGRLVKAGGHVVKNVAGYDLGKLMSGSHGSLAVIVDATFKLLPMPAASRTLVVRYEDAAALGRDAAAIAASQLDAAMFDVHADMAAIGAGRTPYALLLGFATSPASVAAQFAAAEALVTGHAEVVDGAAETGLWDQQVRRAWMQTGAVVRAGWLPAALPRVLTLLADVRRTGARLELTGRAFVGSGLLRIDGEPEAQVAAIEQLRAARDVVGHVVVLRADTQVKRIVDPWGPPRPGDVVARALKRALDPAGILNAGRGPV